MLYLLNPRVWIALALVALLAFSHVYVYRKGAANVRLEWAAAVSQANVEARHLEQERQRRADEAGRMAAARERGLVADAAHARNESDGLRGDLDALERASSQSLAAANAAVGLTSELLTTCSRRYSEVAESADRADLEARELRQAWPH